MSEAKGSGVSLDANTTAQASQLELQLFLRLALDPVQDPPSGIRPPEAAPDPRKEHSG